MDGNRGIHCQSPHVREYRHDRRGALLPRKSVIATTREALSIAMQYHQDGRLRDDGRIYRQNRAVRIMARRSQSLGLIVLARTLERLDEMTDGTGFSRAPGGLLSNDPSRGRSEIRCLSAVGIQVCVYLKCPILQPFSSARVSLRLDEGSQT